MAEYRIATLKIQTDIQFHMTVMILGEEGHTQFWSFYLSEEEFKDPKVSLGPL